MFSVCELHPTPQQESLLKGPMGNIDALKVADFLGLQTYIDKWIEHWVKHDHDILPSSVPLCVENSIQCDSKLMRMYKLGLRHAILNDNVTYVKNHYILPCGPWHWNIVDLFHTSDTMIDLLWEICPATLYLAPFIVEARRYPLWTLFVKEHGASECLYYASSQHWLKGVEHCIHECAEIEARHVKCALTHEPIFLVLTQFGIKPNDELWQEYQLQRLLKRTSLAVEEWFWIHGYK